MNIVNLLAEAQMSQGQYEETIKLIKNIKRNIQQIPIEVHVNHGICLVHSGLVEQARVRAF